MLKKRIFVIALAIILSSCGSTKKKVLPAEDAAVQKVILEHKNSEVDFETLSGRLRVHYKDASSDHSVTVSFRMKKDDTIWMSGKLLGFPLAKVLITPNSVQYYEKISGTYFDGDFRLLSDLLGIPLNFEKVQNLLIGQAIYDLSAENYKLTDSPRGYELEPTADAFLKKMFLLNPANYRVMAQQIRQPDANRGLVVTYPQYQEVNGRIFPEEIRIVANEENESTMVDMEFKSVEFNVPLSFPFSIPSGYEEIILE